MNKFICSGNLCKDSELRYAASGSAIASNDVALNRKWKDAATGELKEAVTFMPIKVFGKSAETFTQYTKKGHKVLLEGRVDMESWEDKTSGQKRSKLVMVVEFFEFMNQKGEGQTSSHSTPPPARQDTNKTSSASTAPVPDAAEDDVPF